MMQLTDYRRPPDDTGRGFHYTAAATHGDDPDRFEPWGRRMREMHTSWTTILDCSASTAKRAIALGLEPIQRVYIREPGGMPIEGEHLHRSQLFIQDGGGRWVQDPHNEINNRNECPNGLIPHPHDLARVWIAWANSIISFGGYPSTPALSPGGNWDDQDYIAKFIAEVMAMEPRRQGIDHPIFDRGAFVAVHTYALNHPADWTRDQNGILGYRQTAVIIFKAIGREIPVLSTEGGPVIGADQDKTMPKVTPEAHTRVSRYMANHMRVAPRWYFSNCSWLIANEEAEHFDPAWSSAAYYQPGMVELPAVPMLKALPPARRTVIPVFEPNANYPDYIPQLRTAAQLARVDVALLAATVHNESPWDPHAYRAEPNQPPVTSWGPNADETVEDGSLGLAQILRSTAQRQGINTDEELYDVQTNLTAAAKIIAWNVMYFGGDLRKPISAYNQGIGGVETRGADFNAGYVDNVLAAYDWYKQQDDLVETAFLYFPETGYYVRGPFLRFFERYGLDICGYPVSEELTMHSLNSQLFQRVIMEEFAPGQVRLKLVTDMWTAAEERLAEIRRIADGQ